MPDKPISDTSPSYRGDIDVTSADVRVLPRDLGPLFAQPPLIEGEIEAEYDELMSKVTTTIAPSDDIEAIWVKDIVDLVWESHRLKRFKASLLMASRKKAIDHLMAQTSRSMDDTTRDLYSGYAASWLTGEAAAVEKLEGLFAKRQLDMNSILAQALADRLSEVERIDRMIASADARRNKALADIEGRREAKARRHRANADDVTDIPWRTRDKV